MARGEGAHRKGGQRAAWYRDGRVRGGAAALVVLAVVVAFLVGSRDDGTRTTAQPGSGAASSAAATSSPSGPPSDPPSDSPSGSTTSASPSPAPAGVPTALRRCSADIVVAEDVLDAGKPGMAHWQEHVEAQSEYVAGRATAEQTAALWKRSRLAGPADVERFREPSARFSRTTDACAGLSSVPAPYDDEARDCVARERAAASAAGAMQAVMRDWTAHQRHMAEFRSGDLAAVQAQELWIEAWRRAPVALRAMSAAQPALDRAPRCSVSADG